MRYVSEFSAAGHLLWDMRMSPLPTDSYRAYRFPWTASPTTAPSVAAARTGGATSVWASWNGATDVTSWQVLAGASAGVLHPVRTVARSGFETGVRLAGTPGRLVAVRALGAGGQVLGTSAAVAPR